MTWNPLRLFSKRILGNLNWILKRKAAFSHNQLDSLPDLFTELKVDLILWAGDFTTTALTEEYEKAVTFVSKFSQDWIAIPGNHDHYTYRSNREKHFYRFLSNKRKSIAHRVDFFNLKEHGIEVHCIAPHWWILALDTARATNPYSSRGLFTEKLEVYFQEILQMLPSSESVICLNHYPFFQQDDSRRNLERGEHLQTLLQKSPQIRLYLHGHTHRHTIADLQPSNLPILLDSGCPVQEKEGTWNLIDLLPNYCEVMGFHWAGSWKPFRKEKMAWQRT
jgi:3',5'-cyclic AMP phosphodiesterase CpdA